MGQGQLGGALNHESQAGGGLARYRVIVAFVLTTLFVGVKALSHDFWAVGFGLAVLGLIVLAPESEHQEPWRQHAWRIVSTCFIVVTLATIWTTLSSQLH